MASSNDFGMVSRLVGIMGLRADALIRSQLRIPRLIEIPLQPRGRPPALHYCSFADGYDPGYHHGWALHQLTRPPTNWLKFVNLSGCSLTSLTAL